MDGVTLVYVGVGAAGVAVMSAIVAFVNAGKARKHAREAGEHHSRVRNDVVQMRQRKRVS
jgi:malic enzyme